MTRTLIDHPVFGFEAPADPDRCVFHYTSLDAAEGIAGSLTFRFSPMSRMNDPREFQPAEPMTVTTSARVSEAEQAEVIGKITERRLNIRAAAFTLDAANGKPNSIPRADGRGYARPTMWAHYGDRHQGVCLAFNRQELQRALTATFGSDVICEKVRYPEKVDPADWSRYLVLDDLGRLGRDGLADRHFQEHRSRLLFEKNSDWQGEREWRCCIDHQDPAATIAVPITPAMIEGIILGIDCSSDDVARVEAIAGAFDVGDNVGVAYLHQMNIIDVLPINTDVSPWRRCTATELHSLGYAGAR